MKKENRVYLLDEIRGFAIICMVIYHICFDLKQLHGVPVPILFENWFDIIRDIFAGTFIFISGTVCRFSSNNLKRGAQCFFLGMVLTFVTAFVTPAYPIMFGILHMLGISMLIFGLSEGLLDHIPAAIGFLLFVLLTIFTFNIPRGYAGFWELFTVAPPQSVYNTELLFPLGFRSPDFASGDYFPLMPWLFLFLAGSFFGVWAKERALPRTFYNRHNRFFALAGRYTIWIYMLHQPIAYGAMMLIFGE